MKESQEAAKLPEVLALAGKLFERKFKTFQSLVRFVEGRSCQKAHRKRGKRLDQETKDKIVALKSTGKKVSDIALELGCSQGQVYAAVNKAKGNG